MSINSNSFTIVLPRKNEGVSSDDVIRVVVEDYDWFTVHYNDRSSNSKTSMEMNWDDLLDYLDDLRMLLQHDVEPFDSFQLQVPGFPCVALSMFDLYNTKLYNTITNVIERYVVQVTC